jgi:hypothetical protein
MVLSARHCRSVAGPLLELPLLTLAHWPNNNSTSISITVDADLHATTLHGLMIPKIHFPKFSERTASANPLRTAAYGVGVRAKIGPVSTRT